MRMQEDEEKGQVDASPSLLFSLPDPDALLVLFIMLVYMMIILDNT